MHCKQTSVAIWRDVRRFKPFKHECNTDSFIPGGWYFCSMSSEMKNGYQEEKKGERNYAKRRIDVSLCLYVYYTRFLLLEKDKKLTVSR